MSQAFPRIAITSGEPAGIGPDICVMLAQYDIDADITIIGDSEMLADRARQLNINLAIEPYESTQASHRHVKNTLKVLHIPTAAPVTAGILNPANSQYVLNTLTCAVDGCASGAFDAIVTAPVHKGVINEAGIAFTGHTEFFAEHTDTPQVVMMLVGGQKSGSLRVALATTHLALKDVPAAITRDSLEATIRILHKDLVHKFGIQNPCILVAGLNPHAGEDGYLGREEIEVINPVLAKLRTEGMHLTGALPADTLFTKKYLENADCVLAMYHDQGLPVLKHASFGGGVNVTLGLPIIRTSVDHGTALDLAGKNAAGTGNIDIGSMLAAVNLAIELARDTTP
ncbi:MAG TPA: 4-hydroxythreonine-4-phosphate dehydrogenase PdxA [Methylotenera sp.]|nr:4-hydroxythreonine-4-phosphate dehydrogenase PdxA [Methylotenera sp.]HPV44041.1 4-hydroxythreonine-4-phosphate dehydrogenase PdxA [Methylotenera sp.]